MEDDGMEAKSLADRMARNMEKLRRATAAFDSEKKKLTGMLQGGYQERFSFDFCI
jgi:hypothetical protein